MLSLLPTTLSLPTGAPEREALFSSGGTTVCKITAHAQSEVPEYNLYGPYKHPWCADSEGAADALACEKAGGNPNPSGAPGTARCNWGQAVNLDCFPLPAPGWHPLDNIILRTPPPSDHCDIAKSEVWNIAGWSFEFVELAPGASFHLPAGPATEMPMYKLLEGTVLDVDYNGVLEEVNGELCWQTYPVTTPNRARSMMIPRGVDKIKAGPAGAFFAYMRTTKETLETPVHPSMHYDPNSIVNQISGPHSELLTWKQIPLEWFGETVSKAWWQLGNFLAENADGSRKGSVQFWTLEEGVVNTDGYHNHDEMWANSTFGEIHADMYVPTGVTGMMTELPGTNFTAFKKQPADVDYKEPGDNRQGVTNGAAPPGQYYKEGVNDIEMAVTMPPGNAHGPLWMIHDDGSPVMTCQGESDTTGSHSAIHYPYHRNLISGNNKFESIHTPPRMLMWIAFELIPEACNVPKELMTHYGNSFVQSMDFESGNTAKGCFKMENSERSGNEKTQLNGNDMDGKNGFVYHKY